MGPIAPKLNQVDADIKQQNYRTFTTLEDEDDDFNAKAKAIAQMIYGSGSGEKENGGEGHIGIVGDKVIKFNTKWGERLKLKSMSEDSVTYQDMKASCNNLREMFRNMAEVAGLKEGDLAALLEKIGGDDAGLLKRTTAAEILKTLVAAHNAKMHEAAKRLTDDLWDGHSPTWKNSVESFRQAVDDHNQGVVTTLKGEYANLVKEAVKGVTNNKGGVWDAPKAVNSVVESKIDDWCGHIDQWLKRTCDFLKGLAPDDTRDGQALKTLKGVLDTHAGSIRDILNDMKGLAKTIAEKGAGVPKEFGQNNKYVGPDKYSTVSAMMKVGFSAVYDKFNSMLEDIAGREKIEFSDNKRFPDLRKDLSGQQIPGVLKDIAGHMKSVCHTFTTAVEFFKDIRHDADTDAQKGVDLSNWADEVFNKVNHGAVEFDVALQALADKKEMPNGANRKAYLESVMQKGSSVDYQRLAQSLLDMKTATFNTPSKIGQLFESVVPSLNLLYKKIDINEAENIQGPAAFQQFVAKLVDTNDRQNKGGIFLYGPSPDEGSGMPGVPAGLLGKGTRSFYNSVNDKNDNSKEASARRASMLYFSRLHDVASVFGVIDKKDYIAIKPQLPQ